MKKKTRSLLEIYAALVLLPCFFIYGPVFTHLSLFLLVLLGVVFTTVAHSMFIKGTRKTVRAQTAGMIASLDSVYGIAAAALFPSEVPSSGELTGGAVILAAALYSTLKASKTSE